MNDHPDTDAIRGDIDDAVAYIKDHDAKTMWTEAEMKQRAIAVKALVDNWLYLNFSLEQGAPLPEDWSEAQAQAGPLGDLCQDAFTPLANAATADFREAGMPGWDAAYRAWQARWLAFLTGAHPSPAGRWGRVEIPGFRTNEGWITCEPRFGLPGVCVVRDWHGAETAVVVPGPNTRIVYLRAPLSDPFAGPELGDTDPFGEDWDAVRPTEDGLGYAGQ